MLAEASHGSISEIVSHLNLFGKRISRKSRRGGGGLNRWVIGVGAQILGMGG